MLFFLPIDRMRILELATQIFDLSGPVLHVVEALYADDGAILANTSKEELEAISDMHPGLFWEG
jgi:uncharacterized protein Yka (UPF0111/DUF47 family)